MEVSTDQFYRSSAKAVRDPRLQRALHLATSRFLEQREAAFAELPNGQLLREKAREIKEETCRRLEEHLDRLERSVCRVGGVVFRASDGEEACRYIVELALKHGVKRAVKSKSMTTEEVGLNEALERAGVEPVETDLGEFIVQLAGEKPSHIMVPAIHKSKEEVADLFAERLGVERSTEIGRLTRIARTTLREKFLTAGMGISGANFAVAETGTVTVLENEGNARLCTTLPPIHVALVGIEKVIPTLEDLPVFLKLLPRSATGQKISSYISLITGPRREAEADGPGEFHLVLLDNGRSRLLQDPDLREALYCLKCGACLNVCPVYQKVGGHAYGWVYPGPIGSILTPQFVGLRQARDLPCASTLCGACREVCPVQIDIPRLLLRLRGDLAGGRRSRSSLRVNGPSRDFSSQVDSGGRNLSGAFRMGPNEPRTIPGTLTVHIRDPFWGRAPWGERVLMVLWAAIMRSPKRYRLASHWASRLQRPWVREGKIRRLPSPLSGWTRDRDFPAVARRPFRERWKALSEEKEVRRRGGEFSPAPQHSSTPASRAPESPVPLLPTPPFPQPPRSAKGGEERIAEGRGSLIEQLEQELTRIGGKLHRVSSPEEARLCLRELARSYQVRRVVRWEASSLDAVGIHRAFDGLEIEVIPGSGAAPERLAGAEMGLTGVEYALADTGTLVLLAREGQGRAVSLLPWVHVAWVTADRVLPGLDALFAQVRDKQLATATSCLTFITGPSRTADIELTLTIGVHGPGELHLVLIE